MKTSHGIEELKIYFSCYTVTIINTTRSSNSYITALTHAFTLTAALFPPPSQPSPSALEG
ncbi:hypothetical protein E2C01_061205 [Portunus trituberculatus]|uniref:Uncharacterized protein n=1 Tax=Portunus trituberculatus TaxID=210409 RepID=A0A5B7HEE9_PORTR|nr:hypothetical protein [Portunus trituberculatus]